MKKLVVTIIVSLLYVAIEASTPQATSTFTITFTFDGANQAAADTKRDNALVDFAKARGLAIYQADGITIDPTKVGPAVRAHVRQQVRDIVIEYRVANGAAALRATESTNLGNP